MGEIPKSSQRRGVKVTVLSKEKTFDLIIHVDAGVNLDQKRSSPQFLIKFKPLKPGVCMTTQEPIHLEFIDLPYNSQVDIRKNFKRDFVVSQGIFCRISLKPQFYLSSSLFKLAESSQKKACSGKLSASCGIDTTVRVASKHSTSTMYNGKGPIPYTRNNLFRPYQGGSVSPK